jgi:predicted enzyme related to lactoylglutathione lyase
MLGNNDAFATIAVKDVKSAKTFYEDTLGLTQEETQEQGVLSYKSGNSRVLVYESQFAGTNKATAATWVIEDQFENVVQTLKAKGVVFEHYDFPGMTRQGDVHVGGNGNMKAAWFKDPTGNILALVSR